MVRKRKYAQTRIHMGAGTFTLDTKLADGREAHMDLRRATGAQLHDTARTLARVHRIKGKPKAHPPRDERTPFNDPTIVMRPEPALVMQMAM